jgi:hypothetical protein
MKTIKLFALLAAVICLAACNKDKEEVRHERDIVYSVASAETGRALSADNTETSTTVHLTTEAEWQSLLDRFCDWAEEGSTVTFHNANKSPKGTKDATTFSTNNRDEMKRWMAQMEDEGLTVTVTFDSNTGTWNGTAYATAPQPPQPESRQGCHTGVLVYAPMLAMNADPVPPGLDWALQVGDTLFYLVTDGHFITANDETLTLDSTTYRLGDSVTLCGNSIWNQEYYGEYFYCLVLDYTWRYPSPYADFAPVYIGYTDYGTFVMAIDTVNRLLYCTSTLDDQGWQGAIGGGRFSYSETGETDSHGGRIIEVNGASTEGQGLRFSLQWHSDGSLTLRDLNYYPDDLYVHTLGEVEMRRTNDYETWVCDGSGYNVVLHIFCGACVSNTYGYSSEPFYVDCITPFRTGYLYASPGFYDGDMFIAYGDTYNDPDNNHQTSFNLEYHGSFRFTLTPTNYTDYCDPNWLFERK